MNISIFFMGDTNRFNSNIHVVHVYNIYIHHRKLYIYIIEIHLNYEIAFHFIIEQVIKLASYYGNKAMHI